MEYSKPWWLSKTIWISLIQAALGVGVASGYVTPEGADQAVGYADQLLGIAVAVLGGLGAASRFGATRQTTAS